MKKKLLLEGEDNMLRYRLGIYVNKQPIYIEIPELKNVSAENSLKEIDKFTMCFVNEEHLKKYLKANNLYNEEKKYRIYVIFEYKGIAKNIPVIYNEARKYMDLNYLRNIIQSYSKDIIFLEKLANHYSIGNAKFNNQLTNVEDIRRYINDVKHTSTKEPFYSKALNNTLDDVVINASNRINKKTGELRLNYRGIRDLAIFVKKYTENLVKKEYEDAMNQETVKGFEYNENYDEPDFAPNSMEEEMYLDYLEELEDEESDYLYEKGKSR